MSTEVVSIGYEGRTLDDLLYRLKEAGVTRVLDVRAVAVSRKPGFSKKVLAVRLAEHGIGYTHLPQAGNPYRQMRSSIERCLARYCAYLEENPDIIDCLINSLSQSPVALLCYERRHDHCHRSVLIDHLRSRLETVRVVQIE